jgi:hypothetical protein
VGPEASEPLKPAMEFVFLCHAPCVTLSRERLTEPRSQGSAREPPPPEPRWLGEHLLML